MFESSGNGVISLSTFVCKVYKHFEKVTDYRVDRGGNHPLIEMIFLTLCASLCDADGWADVERFGKAKLLWLRQFLPFEHGIPSHDSLGRVFARLDTIEFYAALQSWVSDIAGSLKGETVAFDGKTLRGSFDEASSKSALHSVSAWACGMKMCLGLTSTDAKSNEIPAVQQLIGMLDLQGSVVTADAMHCQKDTVEAIINKEADYLLTAKGNQPKLTEAVREVLLEGLDQNKRRSTLDTQEKNRNRDEFREVLIVACPKNHPIFSQWKGIRTIGVVTTIRKVGDREEEVASTCFISSLPPKVRDITTRLRSHWSIENSQHYILDVTFGEDSSRIRKGTGPEISSVFRRLALTILQRDTSIKDNIRGKRKRCSWDDSLLTQLIRGYSKV